MGFKERMRLKNEASYKLERLRFWLEGYKVLGEEQLYREHLILYAAALGEWAEHWKQTDKEEEN